MGGVVFTGKLSSSSVSVAADWVADVADGVFVSMGGVVFTGKLSSVVEDGLLSGFVSSVSTKSTLITDNPSVTSVTPSVATSVVTSVTSVTPSVATSVATSAATALVPDPKPVTANTIATNPRLRDETPPLATRL